MTGTVTTDQPIVDGGVRSVRFFNGRLLTGEDLTREQEANAIARLRLGRAVGDGVATGLEVTVSTATTKAAPVVRIERGIAVNRQGRVLELASALDVALARPRADGTGADVVFHDCSPLQPGTYSAGAGVYVLTIAPGARGEGRAKVNGLGNEESGCNVAFTVEGVQFHLFRVALPPTVIADDGRLRNRLAHELAGTADPRRRAIAVNPLSPPPTAIGLLDDLRGPGCIGDEQVPLAVIMWTAGDGIRFVDQWAVRRRVVDPPANSRFPTLMGERQRAAAEALFLQFEAQIIEASAQGSALSSVRATDRFAFLPPAGIVPITRAGSTAGFDPGLFLGGQGSDELATLDAALVHSLIEASFAHEPITVGSTDRVQRYVVWEAETAARQGQSTQRIMVFAKHTLSFRGRARFGVARFGRSRYAPRVI